MKTLAIIFILGILSIVFDNGWIVIIGLIIMSILYLIKNSRDSINADSDFFWDSDDSSDSDGGGGGD